MDHKCIQEGIIKDHENRIKGLEEDRTETKVYVKLIREDIQDLKADFKNSKSQSQQNDKAWSPVVMELIKLVTLCVTILGSVVGAAKILGK